MRWSEASVPMTHIKKSGSPLSTQDGVQSAIFIAVCRGLALTSAHFIPAAKEEPSITCLDACFSAKSSPLPREETP